MRKNKIAYSKEINHNFLDNLLYAGDKADVDNTIADLTDNPRLISAKTTEKFFNLFHQIASNHNSIALGIIAKIEKHITKSDLNLYSSRNKNGETPFLLALSNGNYDIATELLNSQERMLTKFLYFKNNIREKIKETVNMGNNFNYTPLHELARTGFTQETAKNLLKTILEKVLIRML